MEKTIQVSADPKYGVTKFVPGLRSQTGRHPVWRANILSALLMTGVLTSPSQYRPFHLSAFWAWMRYGTAIASRSSDLRLRRLWSRIDPHQKTILSDDFGMGFPALYLREHFAFEDFADTKHVVERLLRGVASPAELSANGAAKLPDFIVTDAIGRLHILECKGTQIHTYLSTALERGVLQKNNLSNGTIFTSCMVSGLFIPQFSNANSAKLIFVDPKPDKLLTMLSERISLGAVRKEVRRQALAKALNTAGLTHTASMIATGGEYLRQDDLGLKLIDEELTFAEFKRDDKFWKRSIRHRAFEPRNDSDKFLGSESSEVEPIETTLKISVPDDLLRVLKESVSLRQGRRVQGINTSLIDEWMRTKRSEVKKNLGTQPIWKREGDNEVEAHARRSTWIIKEKRISSTLIVSSGIQFSLLRRAVA